MAHTNTRVAARERRRKRLRKKIRGTAERPRLSVFCSSKHVYAQIINDADGTTLAASSTLVGGVREEGRSLANRDGAAKVGADIAARAGRVGIKAVVFDRNGRLYHGKVKALADAAREGGLLF